MAGSVIREYGRVNAGRHEGQNGATLTIVMTIAGVQARRRFGARVASS